VAQYPSRSQVRRLLDQARQSFPHEACLTCECFLGYLAQLAIDSGEEGGSLLAEMKIARARTHSCLGCDPCPPANLFAIYLQDSDQ
jgi:hypothetical protein